MLQLRNITKRFGNVLANDRVNILVRPGTIHALVGENGAGKSTAMRVAYGFYRADSGVAAMTEWVVLLGGLEHDLKIPSMTWLVGMRSANGAEFGIGRDVPGDRRAVVLGQVVREGEEFLAVRWPEEDFAGGTPRHRKLPGLTVGLFCAGEFTVEIGTIWHSKAP